MKRLRTLVVVLLAATAASCDFGPSGPGTLSVTVSGPETLGAALVEVTGLGVTGFVGQGDARVYGAQTATAGTHRVLVVSPTGGRLRFGIEVNDLGADVPVATVLKVASPDNLVVLATGVEVKIKKP